MKTTIVFDGNDILTQDAFYHVVGESLSLPDHFGYNLDALYDILTEQSESFQIIFTHFDQLQDHLGIVFCQHLVNLLNDAGIPVTIRQSDLSL